MTRADRLLMVVLATVALLAWPLAAVASGGAQRVTIAGPAGTTSVALTSDRALLVEGRSGNVRVVVSDGAVRVTDADCPDQICVRTGSICTAGAIIACVPNGVIVRVEGGEPDEFDARVR